MGVGRLPTSRATFCSKTKTFSPSFPTIGGGGGAGIQLIGALHWQGPVHSNNTGIVDPMCSLGCPQQKTTKMYCPVIEEAAHSNFSDTHQHPR